CRPVRTSLIISKVQYFLSKRLSVLDFWFNLKILVHRDSNPQSFGIVRKAHLEKAAPPLQERRSTHRSNEFVINMNKLVYALKIYHINFCKFLVQFTVILIDVTLDFMLGIFLLHLLVLFTLF
ncbi:hypothetical protein L9F63_004900, partial [Diploptera punctata]